MPLCRKGHPRQKQKRGRQNLADNPVRMVPVVGLRDESTGAGTRCVPPKSVTRLNTISTLATDDV